MKVVLKKALNTYQEFSTRYTGCRYGVHSSLYLDSLTKKDDKKNKTLYKQGAYFGSQLSGSMLEQIKEKVMSQLDKTEDCLFDKDGKVVCRSIDHFELTQDELDFVVNDEMKKAMSIGDKYTHKVHRITAWHNYGFDEFSNAEIFSNRYHFDCDPASIVKVFLYLSEVDEESGPFAFLDRDNTMEVCRSGFLYRAQQNENLIKKIDEKASFVTGPSGHLFACTPARVLHRATVPKEGKRRTILQVELRR